MDMLLEQFKILFDRPEKVKKLRELILQFAVRGKLVDQDENDEPAAVLLERIREEKERLVKEGKIKKEKPLPEIREEEKPYELPKGWEWCRLDNLYTTLSDGVHYAPNYTDNGVPCLSAKDIINNTINFLSCKYISVEEYESIKGKFNIIPSSLLITKSGSIGRSAIVGSFTEFAIVESIGVINFNHNLVSVRYIKCLLDSVFTSITYEGNYVKGIGVKHLTLSLIRSIIIPLPPLSEQELIVEKINTLMLFCDNLEKQLERKVKYSSLSSKSVFNSIGNCSSADELEGTLKFIFENFKDLTLGDGAVKELKNAILQLAVQGKLVPQDPTDEPASVLLEKIKEQKERLIGEGKIKREKPLPEISEDEKPYELPKGWEWARLGDISNYGYNNSIIPDNISEDEWILELEDIEKETSRVLQKIYNNERKSKSNKNRFIAGDILYGKLRPYLKKVIVATNNGVCSTEIIPFRGYCNINSSFLMYYMKSPYIDELVNNMTHGMNMPRLGTNQAVKILVALPPLNEQERMVEKINSLMALCDDLGKRIQKYQNYSERLLEAVLKEAFKA